MKTQQHLDLQYPEELYRGCKIKPVYDPVTNHTIWRVSSATSKVLEDFNTRQQALDFVDQKRGRYRSIDDDWDVA